jgi:hypothetical protein
MSATKQFLMSGSFRAASRKALETSMPSDLLYTFAAALFDRSNKVSRKYAAREFYRKAVDRVVQSVKSMKALEEQYYG